MINEKNLAMANVRGGDIKLQIKYLICRTEEGFKRRAMNEAILQIILKLCFTEYIRDNKNIQNISEVIKITEEWVKPVKRVFRLNSNGPISLH